MTDLDLDAIRARADRHAALELTSGRDITLGEISAAIMSADDVPPLLAEIDRLHQTRGAYHTLTSWVTAALETLRRVSGGEARTHHDTCWHYHADCLAALVERTLTGGHHE